MIPTDKLYLHHNRISSWLPATEMQWLRDTHLSDANRAPGDVLPAFGAAAIVGNEDCPLCLVLYRGDDAEVGELPVAVYAWDNETRLYLREGEISG